MYYVEHKSPETISQWLKDTYKIKISPGALRQHFRNHSQVPAEVQEQYEAQKKATKETAGKVIDEISILDQLILDELETHGLLKAWVDILFKVPDQPIDEYGKASLPYIPMPLTTMSQATIAEIRQLIKTKSDLLSGDLKGTEAQMIQQALEKANERKKTWLANPEPGTKTGPEPESKPESGRGI
jgi:hypothetical protein